MKKSETVQTRNFTYPKKKHYYAMKWWTSNHSFHHKSSRYYENEFIWTAHEFQVNQAIFFHPLIFVIIFKRQWKKTNQKTGKIKPSIQVFFSVFVFRDKPNGFLVKMIIMPIWMSIIVICLFFSSISLMAVICDWYHHHHHHN